MKPFLPFTFSIIFLMPNVIAIHSGKYGVNGPAQKARYAVATTEPHFMPNIRCSRYPPHTGVYIRTTTISKSTSVRQSLHSLHIHLQKLTVLIFILLMSTANLL